MTRQILYLVTLFFLILNSIGCQQTSKQTIYSKIDRLVSLGNVAEAIRVASSIDFKRLSTADKTKIDSLLEIGNRYKIDFTLSERAVLSKLTKYQPLITPGELDRLEKAHKIDVMRLDGEKMYFKNCVSNLFLLDSTYAKLKSRIDVHVADSLSIFRLEHTSAAVELSKSSSLPVLPVRMKLRYTITVKANAVPAGETLRCWMPYPRENHIRQKEVHLLKTDPKQNLIAPAPNLQRTIYLEKNSVVNQPTIFQTEIEFTSMSQSFQLSTEMIQPYRRESALYKEYTSERPPQIVFNKNIKALIKNILQDENNPLLQVKKIYKWINDSVTWASALEYSIMPDIPGFVMGNRHGDCGMQTFLFMTLARSAGIPVKWQSGWMLHPGAVNLHDWCEVYYEGVGWVPLDQSFGLQKSSDQRIINFYITGIDSYRMIVNDDFSRQLSPSKSYFRSEPYDFQRGEVEWKGGNLYFDKWSWHMEVSYEI